MSDSDKYCVCDYKLEPEWNYCPDCGCSRMSEDEGREAPMAPATAVSSRPIRRVPSTLGYWLEEVPDDE